MKALGIDLNATRPIRTFHCLEFEQRVAHFEKCREPFMSTAFLDICIGRWIHLPVRTRMSKCKIRVKEHVDLDGVGLPSSVTESLLKARANDGIRCDENS